jgi:3-oxoacyl-[acyl-carrier protein] reductase
MVRSIVITGASKGIGRATADVLVEGGWSVIGVARSSPANFPGVFIEVDLADREKTQALADDLIARGNVVGIVNNVGLARHERVDAVDPAVFAMVMDFAKREQWYGKRGISPGIFDSMLEPTTRAVGSPKRRYLALSQHRRRQTSR